MNSLSIFTYYARNKRKALPVLGILALAVFGISLSLVLTGTLMESVRGIVTPYVKFIVVQPNYNKKYNQIDPGLRAAIRRSSHLGAYVPVETADTYERPLGIQQGIPIFAVDEAGMNAVLAATGATLIAGRMPLSHENEVVLHEMVARTRGLWVGSEIGRDVDTDDYINGKWTVVGILGGETILNLAPLERVNFGRPASQMLLIPRPGEMEALVADVESQASDRVVVQTRAYYTRFIDRILDQFDSLLTAINVVIIVVLSLGVGLLNMIYFRQRLPEFGLLTGIGFSRSFLVRRVTLEALVLTVIGWLVGVALATVVYQFLNVLIFVPQGTPLSILNERALGGTLPVPLFVWVFSTITVVWQLSRLDPVAVIERRD